MTTTTKPMSKAAAKRKANRAAEAGADRKRGFVELTVPDELVPDARHLGAKWDPTNRVWLGKRGIQEQIDAIEDAAPGGETHFVKTTDCPFCERPECYHKHSYRPLGTAEWLVDEVVRCDFCFAITSHPLFVALDRQPDEPALTWLTRCAVDLNERLDSREATIATLQDILTARPDETVAEWAPRVAQVLTDCPLVPPVTAFVVFPGGATRPDNLASTGQLWLS